MTQQTITFPYAQAHQLLTWGGTVGARVSGNRKLAHVTLPDGWSTDEGTRHGVPVALRDQHGRLRATIRWTTHLDPGGSYYDTLDGARFSEPDSHARAVAEHGDPLILDTWARPSLMIGVAAERVETYHDLINSSIEDSDRWRDEQPAHAEHLDAQRRDYERKLAAWEDLFARLAHAIRHGWTIRNAAAAQAVG
jgi:hypothetical protein